MKCLKLNQIKELIIRGEDSKLPAILVMHKNEGDKDFQVVDGHHRYWVYKELRKENNLNKGVKVRIIPDYMIKEVMFKEDLPRQFL